MIIRKRIMFVFGTRPEAIKLAPVIGEIKKHPDVFDPIIVTTGQHKQMLDQVLKIFDIKPDYDLGIMEEEQTVSNIVVRSLQGLSDIVLRERPDMMIVQGDTSTTFAASLSSFYHKITLAHVEAGLRTWNKFKPYPEEMNRKLTSALADIHFAPTFASVQNLKNEGVQGSSIYLTGNTVIDALFDVAKRRYDLKEVGLNLSGKEKVITVTVHRRESFGAPFRLICSAVKKIALKYSKDVKIVIPVHKNPIAAEYIEEILGDVSNIELVQPLDYVPFVHLMKASYLILTDSGGIQEEAPSLGKPVLVLREVTERPEGVEAGTVKVVGVKPENIVAETEKLIEDKDKYDKMTCAQNPYGDGLASKRIARALLHYFGLIDRRPEEFKGAKRIKEKSIA